MVVSPTYFGACADVAGLVEVAHRHGVPIAVDEAWGAHLRFHPDLPADALSCGADLVVSSTHKIVGSLTQAAMLHLGAGGTVDEAVVDRCVSLVETTSPSALLSGSLDAARRQASVHGERAARRDARRRSPRPARRSRRSPASRVLDDGMVGRAGIAGWDPLRLAIDVRGTGSTGYRLAKVAFELDDGIDLELAAENVVVAIFGLGEPAADAGRAAGRRRCARRSGGSAARTGAPQEPLAPPPPWGELVMTPREAFLGPQEVIPFDDAAGRVAAECARRLPAGDPQRPPRRAPHRARPSTTSRERRPRRLRARRQRPPAEDAAGRSLGSGDGQLRRIADLPLDDRGLRARGARASGARRLRTADAR